MMKFEECRRRESTRDHYGKRRLVVHGGLIKYERNDSSVVKRIYYTVPEGDGTQDSKAALCNVDVLCSAIKEDNEFRAVTNIMLLSDNAGTYSSNIFHVAAFDVVKSHGLRLINIIHNEAQDGKTELDSSFYHFKQQLYKWSRFHKTSVLTPRDMANAMYYGRGLPNCRFDIVQFDRPYLNKLYDESGDYYGKMLKRLKQVFPQHVAEIRTTDNSTNEIYTLSAHNKAYDFSTGKLKKINKWMKDNKGDFNVGYDFFKRLVLENDIKNDITLPDFPSGDESHMMTKTTIL